MPSVAKERLIELLTEQRQAVIHQAVTRGLDPNVRLKDSGVEWFGEVPEHWETVSVKTWRLFSSQHGNGVCNLNRCASNDLPASEGAMTSTALHVTGLGFADPYAIYTGD